MSQDTNRPKEVEDKKMEIEIEETEVEKTGTIYHRELETTAPRPLRASAMLGLFSLSAIVAAFLFPMSSIQFDEARHSLEAHPSFRALFFLGTFCCLALTAACFSLHAKQKAVRLMLAYRDIAEKAKLDTQSLAFDKETAEHSVTLLEQELQRLLKQLGDVRSGTTSFTPVTLLSSDLISPPKTSKTTLSNFESHHDATSHSPRIPAGRTSGDRPPCSLSRGLHAPSDAELLEPCGFTSPWSGYPPHTLSSPLHSPSLDQMKGGAHDAPCYSPPPTRVVESYLKARNAIAVDEEQLKAWLTLEGDIPKLKDALHVASTEIKEKEVCISSLVNQAADAEERLTSTEMIAASKEAELRKQNAELVEQVQKLSHTLAAIQGTVMLTSHSIDVSTESY